MLLGRHVLYVQSHLRSFFKSKDTIWIHFWNNAAWKKTQPQHRSHNPSSHKVSVRPRRLLSQSHHHETLFLVTYSVGHQWAIRKCWHREWHQASLWAIGNWLYQHLECSCFFLPKQGWKASYRQRGLPRWESPILGGPEWNWQRKLIGWIGSCNSAWKCCSLFLPFAFNSSPNWHSSAVGTSFRLRQWLCSNRELG